jgi:hypothetical protein
VEGRSLSEGAPDSRPEEAISTSRASAEFLRSAVCYITEARTLQS